MPLGNLKTHFSKVERSYTGKELRPHFLLSELSIQGSGLGVFCGPCKVETECLVDWEDRLNKDFIEAKQMIHLIGEFFGITLSEGVLIQRLLMSVAGESLNEFFTKNNAQQHGTLVSRLGDDLFIAGRKLSVSIVTSSPVSQLLHCGINLDSTGAPVRAIGLYDLGYSRAQIEEVWIPIFLEKFKGEWESIDWACAKVRPVI